MASYQQQKKLIVGPSFLAGALPTCWQTLFAHFGPPQAAVQQKGSWCLLAAPQSAACFAFLTPSGRRLATKRRIGPAANVGFCCEAAVYCTAGFVGDEVAGIVFSADRYELARIRSDGNAVLKPEGPRTPLGVFSCFCLYHKRMCFSVFSVLPNQKVKKTCPP